MTTLRFQRALITGASRGLGRSLALLLASHGLEVILVARNAAALEEVVAEVEAAGGRAVALVGDVGEPDPSGLSARALEHGPIDLLIHNASTLGPLPMPPLAELDDGSLSEVFEVNVLGPQRLTRALLGSMRSQPEAAIVSISSDAAVEAYPGWGAYGASKAALDHVMRVLAAELDDTNIRVIAVDPGEMDTKMHADALPDADPTTLSDPHDVAEQLLSLLVEPAGPARRGSVTRRVPA